MLTLVSMVHGIKGGIHLGFFFAAVMEGFTGVTLDYSTICSFCEKCTKKKNLVKTKKCSPEQYDGWYAEHASDCDKNYEGSAASMEAAAAVMLWERSVDSNFRYIRFISDGDSKSFLKVTQMNGGQGPYGTDYPVEKEECVNHVSKRLVTHLMNLSNKRRIQTRRGLGGAWSLDSRHYHTPAIIFWRKRARIKKLYYS